MIWAYRFFQYQLGVVQKQPAFCMDTYASSCVKFFLKPAQATLIEYLVFLWKFLVVCEYEPAQAQYFHLKQNEVFQSTLHTLLCHLVKMHLLNFILYLRQR